MAGGRREVRLRLRCWIHLVDGRKPQRQGGRACVWTCFFCWFEVEDLFARWPWVKYFVSGTCEYTRLGLTTQPTY